MSTPTETALYGKETYDMLREQHDLACAKLAEATDALATIQAENVDLHRQLALAAEDQHADRAEAATLRERLEAATSIKSQLQWWRDWATSLIGDGTPEAQQGALASLIEERERIATRELARATAAEGERDALRRECFVTYEGLTAAVEQLSAAREKSAAAEGKRDRFAGLVEQAQRGQLPWRDEMGNDRGTAAGSAVAYEARIAALEERDALRDSVALSRSKMLHEAEGERDRLREALERIAREWKPGRRATRCDPHTVATVALLAATPHTEGEASAPPKETTP